jgi:hypothetical protein
MAMHNPMRKDQKSNLVTLRNLPNDLVLAIRKRAEANGISLNKAVIGLLQDNLGGQMRKKQIHHDLDALAGSWTKQEAREFEKALAAQRRLDLELWK